MPPPELTRGDGIDLRGQEHRKQHHQQDSVEDLVVGKITAAQQVENLFCHHASLIRQSCKFTLKKRVYLPVMQNICFLYRKKKVLFGKTRKNS
jgi:hypothetical protein